jgi:hypothetical protein
LSPEQVQAVKDAVAKLKVLAAGWPKDDLRHKPLKYLCRITEGSRPPATITNAPMPDSQGAQTMPKDGRMDPSQDHHIQLNGSKWRPQPNGGQWGLHPNPVACWDLACLLLHEADHNDDRYPWPPVTPFERRDWLCDEFDAHCKQIDTLKEGRNSLTGPGAANAQKLLDINIAAYEGAKAKIEAQKNSL